MCANAITCICTAIAHIPSARPVVASRASPNAIVAGAARIPWRACVAAASLCSAIAQASSAQTSSAAKASATISSAAICWGGSSCSAIA
eukprot:CAMPEP_0202341136 /NCGR_PEP_ID=MMETSP1126-20121109/2272_1 /ASSEMBLY_ACC=CAM_ASM_000457 /TAXON_ID=3047 /ORGANISM="Dunaliella tertiolecta, Strain CCMP1320" /LENGTH=88 /DNA_ID=CAMNT_0048931933 /DNA_START=622 /DNA_END=889 /DNA_ORIENTATION=+